MFLYYIFLQALDGMPLAHGNAETADVTTSFNEDGVGQLAFVDIIEPLYFASQYHHGLGGVAMPMDGHHRAGLQGVEHTLALVGGAVAQVEVHPQPWRGLRLSGQCIEKVGIYDHFYLTTKYPKGANRKFLVFVVI